MEKNVIYWGIGIVVMTAFLFNISGITGNVAKSGSQMMKEPVLKILNPDVEAGSDLIVKVNNIRSLTSSRLNVFYTDEKYSGLSFPISRGDCKSVSAGYYDCESTFNIPHSQLPNGKYYLQVKSDQLKSVTGNKAFFTVSNSQNAKTGR